MESIQTKIFNRRYARMFVDLTGKESLLLASRHTSSECFRHEMTFQDEVNKIRTIILLS